MGFRILISICVDDFTREGFLDVLEKGKGEAFSSFQSLQKLRNNDHAPYKLAIIRTDSEPLYTAPHWSIHCEATGLEHEYSSRYRHDQNGVVERAMQAIGVPFRCMIIQGNAPEEDIPDALNMANVVRNNSPTKANGGWMRGKRLLG